MDFRKKRLESFENLCSLENSSLSHKLPSEYDSSEFKKALSSAPAFTTNYESLLDDPVTAFRGPVIFEDMHKIGLKRPNKSSLTIEKIAKLIGEDYPLQVYDCASQEELKDKWTMKKWTNYWKTDTKDQIYNVISLEVSYLELGNLVIPPEIVRDVDWKKHWDAANPGFLYPPIRKYCLMSRKGSFTDFHIDFGGSSVWYNVVKGAKIFVVIPPKPAILHAFKEWNQDGNGEVSKFEGKEFFSDIIEKKDKFILKMSEGSTLLLPSGWAHCVYTPEDSLVFGGNFMHSGAIKQQISVHLIQKSFGLTVNFLFPYFEELHWYTALFFLKTLKNTSKPTLSFLEKSLYLVKFLQSTLKDSEFLQRINDASVSVLHEILCELEVLLDTKSKGKFLKKRLFSYFSGSKEETLKRYETLDKSEKRLEFYTLPSESNKK